MIRDLPGILVSLVIFVPSMLALAEIRIKGLERRREERFREWIMKDLPPLPRDDDDWPEWLDS